MIVQNLKIKIKKIQNFSTYKSNMTYNCKTFCTDSSEFIYNPDYQFLKRLKKLPSEEQVVLMYMFLGDYLDHVDLNKRINFELKWVKFLKENHNDILIEIRDTRALSKNSSSKLGTLCLNFLLDFNNMDIESAIISKLIYDIITNSRNR